MSPFWQKYNKNENVITVFDQKQKFATGTLATKQNQDWVSN